MNNILETNKQIEDYQKNREILDNRFKDLNIQDFKTSFEDLYLQPYSIPSSIIKEIFDSMHKTTEQKRRIDCKSCGYPTCVDMVKAIAYGYNRKENCIDFMNQELKNRINKDPLTKLPNRIYYIKIVSEILEKNPNKKYVICKGDINNLKTINDIGGMEVGDKVICYIAETLKSTFKENALVAYLNGGIFILFFEYNPENMRKLHSIPYFDCKSVGLEMPVTMRFGIYIRQNSTDSLNNMLNYATITMDKKSSMQTNTFTLFTQEFKDQMIQRTTITTQMERAINDDEFTLYFQPQYSAKDKTLIGAESLCRWIKKDGSIIPPNEFIPISELNGFIRILDRIIWEKAFTSMRKWLDLGLKPVPLSINISRVSLQSDTLIYIIEQLKQEYKIPDELIHFEITESAYMEEQSKLIERIKKIGEIGFKIAMDDFGSGYSSLNSLKDLPIDIIKLDMGFLSNTKNIAKGKIIINSIIDMAKKLDFLTIAEGVEAAEQVEFLKNAGCDVIQGYIYSKPIPEEQFIELLKRN